MPLMSSKEQIIQLRTENPLMNSVEIGTEVGVSKQYVHKILRKEGLNTSVPKKKQFNRCKQCNEPVGPRINICSEACRFTYYRLKVKCSFCHVHFYVKRAQVIQKHRRKYKNIYCSLSCSHRGRKDKNTYSRIREYTND